MREKLLIIPHVEKTAGTTVLKHLISGFPADEVLRHSGALGFTLQSDLPIVNHGVAKFDHGLEQTLRRLVDSTEIGKKLLTLKRALDEVMLPESRDPYEVIEDISVVIGHFRADLFDTVERPKEVAMVFRDPLDRMISQYLHYNRRRGVTRWRVNHPFGLSFEDYAFDPHNVNFQTNCLGTYDLDDIDIVGVTREMDKFLQSIGILDECESASRFNEAPGNATCRFRQGLGDSFVREFEDVHSADYELYESALVRAA